MPVGENVSEEMAAGFRKFLQDSYTDYIKNKSRATLRGLVISLYETSKVMCTLIKDSNHGAANYKYVRQSLPIADNVFALEKLRDNLVHNYHKVSDVIVATYDALLAFGEENFEYLAKICGLPNKLYSDILNFCEAYMQRMEVNTPLQSNLEELADMYKNM